MKIRDVMSKNVQVARPEDTLQNVAGRMAAGDFGFIPVADGDLKVALDLMSSRQIRRLPVVDKDGRLVGVVSLGDLSTRVKERYAGEALEEISRPG